MVVGFYAQGAKPSNRVIVGIIKQTTRFIVQDGNGNGNGNRNRTVAHHIGWVWCGVVWCGGESRDGYHVVGFFMLETPGYGGPS